MIQPIVLNYIGTAAAIEHGQCPCGGSYERRTVEVRLTTGELPILIAQVPQGACLLCGSRVYKADILERIEALSHAAHTKSGA